MYEMIPKEANPYLIKLWDIVIEIISNILADVELTIKLIGSSEFSVRIPLIYSVFSVDPFPPPLSPSLFFTQCAMNQNAIGSFQFNKLLLLVFFFPPNRNYWRKEIEHMPHRLYYDYFTKRTLLCWWECRLLFIWDVNEISHINRQPNSYSMRHCKYYHKFERFRSVENQKTLALTRIH